MKNWVKMITRGLVLYFAVFFLLIPLYIIFAFWVALFAALGAGAFLIILIYILLIPAQLYVVGYAVTKTVEDWVK